ncbi:alpha/beta hydrolase [Xanthobacter pseudotagetidis]|uniref:alpha/beta hydrolase n=1 Tax=Xanthobacter pseudotagetidis TaxID=3119911 RepID=UPI003728C1A2
MSTIPSPLSCPSWTERRIATASGEVPVRVYGRPAAGAPLVLNLHGGAFTEGSCQCGDLVARLLAAAGAVVVSAEYPLACEHPFPFALTAMAGLLAALYAQRGEIARKSSKLFVAGVEAGGNLAAGLAMMARDQQQPPLAGQILISPMLDPTLATASWRDAEIGASGCKWADGWQKYLGTADKASHPYAAPLASSRLAGLAPALIVSAEDDPLRDESVAYARALAKAGVATTIQVLEAPTEWPEGLDGEAAAPPAWEARLTALFAAFFKSATGRRKAAALSVL